jgi:hypothetical protein
MIWTTLWWQTKNKEEESTCLTYTGLCEGLEHLKIETRLTNKRLTSVMGECVILTTQVFHRYSKYSVYYILTKDISTFRFSWIEQTELLKMQKSGQFPDETVRIKVFFPSTEVYFPQKKKIRRTHVGPTTIGSLFHFGKFSFALLWVCQFRHYLDPLSGVFVILFITTRSEITYRHVDLSRWLHILMIGWYTVWVAFWVRWVTELRSTRLPRWRTKKGVTSR